MKNEEQYIKRLHGIIQRLINTVIVLVVIIIILPVLFYNKDAISLALSVFSKEDQVEKINFSTMEPAKEKSIYWAPKDMYLVTNKKKLDEILYGEELVINTAKYLGPRGSVKPLSNGLNCQNCHLDAGTRVFGNNYGSVQSMYPKLRARSGQIESIEKRINDCFERSLNGKALSPKSKEMKAMKAYITYIGSNVKKGKKAAGSGLKDITFLARAADPKLGLSLYENKCASCHQINGEGMLAEDGIMYTYPPLWGNNSFNDAAGLYRISNMAKYVKYNMPYGVTHESAQLSDEETWDISAYILSKPRPHKAVPKDWPDISKKPIDHPFGPYKDQFSELQHKYGPFNTMKVKK